MHGRNARVSNGGRTASRPKALGEFNDAIVMSNRPLNEDEMFAVVIEKIVDRWSGSIEAGKVTFNVSRLFKSSFTMIFCNIIKSLVVIYEHSD